MLYTILFRQGELSFVSGGTLKGWTLATYAPKVNKPVLLVNGEFDMSQDLAVKPYFDHLPKVKWIHLNDCSHMPFYEIPDKYIEIIKDFLE